MATIRDRVNMVINTIQLLEDSPVVTAAAELDRCLVRLEDEAMASQWSRDGWRTRRNEVLGPAVDDVYAAGRRALRRAPLARAQLWSSADRRVLGRVGANAPAGDTATTQTYSPFAATLGGSVPTGSTPVLSLIHI